MTYILEEKEKFMVGDIVSFKDENPEGVSDERLVISEIRRMNTDDVIILLRCEDSRTIATDPGNIRKEGHMEERSEPLGDIVKGCTVRVNFDSDYNDKIKNKDLKVERMYWTDDIVVSLKSETEVIVNEVLVNAEDVYIPHNGSPYKTKEDDIPKDGINKKDEIEYNHRKYKACVLEGLKQQEYAKKAIRSMEEGWLFTVKEGVIPSISENRRVYVRNMKFVVAAVFEGSNGVKHLIVRGKDGNLYGMNEKNDVRIKELSVYRPLNKEDASPSKSKGIPKEKMEEAADYIFRKRPSEDSEGRKNDFLDDKLRWDLLPMAEIEDIVKVYHAGAKKYGDNNWQNLENGFERYRAALMRHMLEYMKGERVDADTGSYHLAQVCWNAIAMLWLDKHNKGLYPIDLMPGK